MDVIVNRTGQAAYFTAVHERHVFNTETDLVIGTAVEFDDTKPDRTCKPYAGGKFAGIVAHTDDHVYDETANTKTITAPATVSLWSKGNIWVLAGEAVKAGDQAGLDSTGKFVLAASGTKLNAHFETAGNANEEVILVLDNLNKIV
jgi:hypothetical protein